MLWMVKINRRHSNLAFGLFGCQFVVFVYIVSELIVIVKILHLKFINLRFLAIEYVLSL